MTGILQYVNGILPRTAITILAKRGSRWPVDVQFLNKFMKMNPLRH